MLANPEAIAHTRARDPVEPRCPDGRLRLIRIVTATRGPKLRFRRRPPPHCFRLAARDTEIVRLLRYSPLGLADGLSVNLTRLRDRSDACNRRWRKTQQCERRV